MEFCSIASGSSGNAFYVGSRNTKLLIDAGVSKKKIEEGLKTCGLEFNDIDAILITHEHSDHIKSLGVLNRAVSKPIYCTRGTFDGIKLTNLGRINYDDFYIIKNLDEFYIGDIKINSIPTCHDCFDPCSYRFECEGKCLGLLTDCGKYNKKIIELLKNLDALILEANHDTRMLETGPYPYHLKQRIIGDTGHLSNEQSGELINEIIHPNLKSVYLAHLSKDNNYAELALETIKLEVTLDNRHNFCGNDLDLSVLKRDEVYGKIVL